MYHVGPRRRAGGARVARWMQRYSDMPGPVATTHWEPSHIHPRGSWWQYRNDRRSSQLTLIALAVMAIISVALLVWVVMAA